jgi:hypothetical protein
MTEDAAPRLEDFLDDAAEPPEVLWHYTDAAGLQGILETRTFWATEATFSNDAAEIHHGLGVWRDAVDSYEYMGKKSTTGARVKALRVATHQIMGPYVTTEMRPFLVCFCDSGDVLSQWRAYGGSDTAGGYALGFAPPETSVRFRLSRVVYDRDAQRSACAALVDASVRAVDKNTRDMGRFTEFLLGIRANPIEAATTFKDPAFAEEHEWRLVYLRDADRATLDVKHRVSRGLLLPYVEVETPRLVAVNCGPSPDPALKQAGVRSLLDANGYQDVTVEGSLAPLRV